MASTRRSIESSEQDVCSSKSGESVSSSKHLRVRPSWVFVACCCLVLWSPGPGFAQASEAAVSPPADSQPTESQPEREIPRTRAEASDYRETSSHWDVLQFLSQLQRAGADFVLTNQGVSTQGREIPLVIVARPPVSDPAQALRTGKVIVYLQANIHGGEVEGKEVAQMLLRDITLGRGQHLLDRLILLIAPIYNTDGNDAWGTNEENRSHQQGPARIGKRPNGIGLDLNRDCTKAESREMQGALEHVYTRWNPDVVLDLHTTNGTRHHYALTYAPPLHPNTPSGVVAFTRDEMLPAIRARVRERHGLELFDYGNIDSVREPKSWATFSPEPRYVTNYAGLRNRIGILSEATSYLPFRDRVVATRVFVSSCLEYLAEHASRVTDLVRTADQEVTAWGLTEGKQLGIRFEHASRGKEVVLLEGIPSEGAASPDPKRRVEASVEIKDRFRPTRFATLPRSYVVPADQERVIALLRRHGVVVLQLDEEWTGECEAFEIREVNRGRRLYQGHRVARLEGTFSGETKAVPAGAYLVPTAQPLGGLIFLLLEPESLDGCAAWKVLDGLKPDQVYPILKIHQATRAATRAVR